MADFILFEGTQIIDLRLPAIGYFVFISILFTLPLFSFSGKLIDAREESIFRNDDFANGLFRELKIKLSKGYDKVTADDLKSPDYSAAGDLSAVMQNALKMRTLPFALKDIVPLWVMTGIPFIAIVLLEVPINEILKELISFVV